MIFFHFVRSHFVEVHAERAEERSVVVPDGQVHSRSAMRRNQNKLGHTLKDNTCTAVGLGCKHSHAQLGVVQEVLHRVEAGELVLDLRAVRDGAASVVCGGDHARDVDVLDVWEVRKLTASDLSNGLETTENVFSVKNLDLLKPGIKSNKAIIVFKVTLFCYFA